MITPIYSEKCVNGTLEVYNDKIIIKNEGIFSKASRGRTSGDKTIFFKNISAIQLKKGGRAFRGYLQFTIAGGNEVKGGIKKAVNDENSILFNNKQNDLMGEIKEFIESKMTELHGGKNTNQDNSGGSADEIEKLHNLLQKGIISQTEFDEGKAKILGL